MKIVTGTANLAILFGDTIPRKKFNNFLYWLVQIDSGFSVADRAVNQ